MCGVTSPTIGLDACFDFVYMYGVAVEKANNQKKKKKGSWRSGARYIKSSPWMVGHHVKTTFYNFLLLVTRTLGAS